MSWESVLALLALLVAIAAALYARRAATEAKNANVLGRLNALLALRLHYLAQMENQGKLMQALDNVQSGRKAAEETCAGLDTKLREVSREIDACHARVIALRI